MAVWIYYVVAPHKGLKLGKRDAQDLTEVRELLATRIKQWEKEFIEKGLEQGLEKGREQGELIGEAKTLTKMLVLKFGALPDWATQSIANADQAQLDQWIEKLLDANSLDDVLK